MKSALCLLSGKSCAWLIEMFIRQIYGGEKEEGRAGSTTVSDKAGGISGETSVWPRRKRSGGGRRWVVWGL